MNAGALDVFHHGANHHVGTVGERINVGFERVFKKPVDKHRPVFTDQHRSFEIACQRRGIVHNLHRPAAEYIRRSHKNGIPDPFRDRERFVNTGRRPIGRLCDPELTGERLESPPILGDVDRVRARAENANTGSLKTTRQFQWCLSAELNDHANRSLPRNDLEHVLQRERFEIQLVRNVEIGRHRLRI